jgi:hypothetical protein
MKTLSDKKRKIRDYEIGLYAYTEEDVKEFIKELKMEFTLKKNEDEGIWNIIDKLAGDKLI